MIDGIRGRTTILHPRTSTSTHYCMHTYTHYWQRRPSAVMRPWYYQFSPLVIDS